MERQMQICYPELDLQFIWNLPLQRKQMEVMILILQNQ